MIPRTLYDSDHQMFRDSVRKLIENEALPQHAQWEKDGCVSRDIWLQAGAQVFYARRTRGIRRCWRRF